MDRDLVRLPSISEFSSSLNVRPLVPQHAQRIGPLLPGSSQIWGYSANGLPPIPPPPQWMPSIPLHTTPIIPMSAPPRAPDAPRSMAPELRFVDGHGARGNINDSLPNDQLSNGSNSNVENGAINGPHRRRKKPIQKLGPSTQTYHGPRKVCVNDPTVKFPVQGLPLNGHSIPGDELHRLNTAVYPSVTTRRYSAAALDPNNAHLMVYEYSIGAYWVIWDYDTGYVHLTGLWRAALQERGEQRRPELVLAQKTNPKADIVRLLELTPKALHSCIKRVRGGFLKIQGTWVPYHLCKQLARRFCYYIRYQLVPIFGASFPDECLHPSAPGFGELRFEESGPSLLPSTANDSIPKNEEHFYEMAPESRTQFSHSLGSGPLPHFHQQNPPEIAHQFTPIYYMPPTPTTPQVAHAPASHIPGLGGVVDGRFHSAQFQAQPWQNGRGWSGHGFDPRQVKSASYPGEPVGHGPLPRRELTSKENLAKLGASLKPTVYASEDPVGPKASLSLGSPGLTEPGAPQAHQVEKIKINSLLS